MAKIITRNDHLLIKAEDVKHLLRHRDRGMAETFFDYLNEASITPYLGGGVVKNYLFDGNKNYDDIDVVGIVEPSIPFNGLEKRNEFVKVLESFSDKVLNLDIPGYHFSVFPDISYAGGGYCGLPISKKFIITPKGILSKILGRKNIDFSMIDSEGFKLYTGFGTLDEKGWRRFESV